MYKSLGIGGLLVLGMLLTLAGCQVQELGTHQSLHSVVKGQNVGVVVLSIDRTGVRDFDLIFDVHGIDHSFSSVVRLSTYKPALDWTGAPGSAPTPRDQPEGRLYVMVLPAGRYEITRWSGESRFGGMSGDGFWIYSNPISVTFQSIAGQTTYAGDIQLDLSNRIKILTFSKPGVYQMEIKDMQKRDLARLAGKYPDLKAGEVKVQLAQWARPHETLAYHVQNTREGGSSFGHSPWLLGF